MAIEGYQIKVARSVDASTLPAISAYFVRNGNFERHNGVSRLRLSYVAELVLRLAGDLGTNAGVSHLKIDLEHLQEHVNTAVFFYVTSENLLEFSKKEFTKWVVIKNRFSDYQGIVVSIDPNYLDPDMKRALMLAKLKGWTQIDFAELSS